MEPDTAAENASGERTRFAIPTEGAGGIGAARSAHFGRAESFTIVDVAGDEVVSVLVMDNGPHEHGACGSIVSRLAAERVDVVIAGGMGAGPRNGFASAGIPVFFDASSPTPADAIASFLAGRREAFADDHACRGH